MPSDRPLPDPDAAPRDDAEGDFERLVRELPELVCRCDPEGVLTFVNRAYCRAFEETEEGLLGRSFFELLPEEDRSQVRERLARLGPDLPHAVTEHRVLAPGGAVRWQQWTDQALFDARGAVTGFLCVGRDVTRQRLALERLARHERLASIGTLAAGIAHEINNPLGAILLAAQGALRYLDQGDPAIARDALRLIESEALRCGSMVKSVLRFSLAETSERWVVGLNDAVENARQLTRKYVEERGGALDVATEGAPKARCNPTEIELLLVHLVREAVEDGRSPKRILLSAVREGPWARLRVEHDGGRAESVGEASPEEESTLEARGLAVVRSIAEQHGGGLEVEPAGGGGRRVTISLPAEEGPAERGPRLA